MIASLQFGARCPCGYCHISDVEFHKKEDHMESFFLQKQYIFGTEGHLLPATPQISLAKERCSYFGAYCKSGDSKEKSDTLDVSDDPQETNGSKVFGDRSHTGFPSDSFLGSIPATGLIKEGFCPGLTHGQKYGITYLASEDVSTTPKESTAVQSHSVVVVSDQP
ncbi:hypothetical protein Q3G72_010231 [Acer saccharum]|nr:hypothetical protein Q3G72_010231 [Acer saccharum]